MALHFKNRRKLKEQIEQLAQDRDKAQSECAKAIAESREAREGAANLAGQLEALKSRSHAAKKPSKT